MMEFRLGIGRRAGGAWQALEPIDVEAVVVESEGEAS